MIKRDINGIIIFCLVFWGTAFSQDSLSVSLQDSLLATGQLDTAAMDTAIVSVPDTTLAVDTTLVQDTTLTPDTTLTLDTAIRDTTIRKGLHFFASISVQFINFKDRAKFQGYLDEQFAEYQADYNENSEGYLIPQKQDFQRVNLMFPIALGLIWQFNDMHSLGLGGGFMYTNESVILTDKDGKTNNLKYTLQAFPVFAEYRLRISPDLMSLQNGDYFSLFFRYYWMFPPTEIYSTWGQAKADFEPSGNGFGVFLGYRFAEWEGFSVLGEIGYLSLDVKSSAQDALLNSWNLGGIALLVRVML